MPSVSRNKIKMTSLSIEEENYVRMGLLLTGISPRAARALFDQEFAPSSLDAALKKEYSKLNDMKNNKIISQPQWNLLFTRFPGKYQDTHSVAFLIQHLKSLLFTRLTDKCQDFQLVLNQNQWKLLSTRLPGKYQCAQSM